MFDHQYFNYGFHFSFREWIAIAWRLSLFLSGVRQVSFTKEFRESFSSYLRVNPLGESLYSVFSLPNPSEQQKVREQMNE